MAKSAKAEMHLASFSNTRLGGGVEAHGLNIYAFVASKSWALEIPEFLATPRPTLIWVETVLYVS